MWELSLISFNYHPSFLKEVEKCDYLSAFLMTHSLGGGTGSGLGSRLLLWIRDSFPLINLTTVSCGGFTHESPVNNYNAVLALAQLQSVCDGIVLFSNDHVVETLRNKNTKSSSDAASRSSLHDLNAEICLSLHGALLPTSSLNAGCEGGAGNNNWGSGDARRLKSGASISFNMEPLELIRTLAPMPTHKFLQMDTVTLTKDGSPNVAQLVCRAMKRPWRIGVEDTSVEKV